MWDERYSEPGFAYGAEPNDFLAATAHLIGAGPVLCLAEGEGRNAVHLAGRGHEVHAVDLSAVGMAKAARLASERGLTVHTHVADLANFDLGEARWGGIVSIFAHLPPPVRALVHRRVVSALRPGGWLILEAYAPRQLRYGTGGPPVAGLLMELGALRAELDGLELVLAREVDREVHEGRYHHGMSAVVQILGRRPGSA